jgi:hypothetical protein
MFAYLSALFLAALALALIAFGWYPCCCASTTCPWAGGNYPASLDWIAETDGVCACTGTVSFNSDVGGAVGFVGSMASTCGASDAGSQLTFNCIPGPSGTSTSNPAGLINYCKIAHPDDGLNSFLELVSVTYTPAFQAVFQGRLYDANNPCPCDGQLITITFTEPP